MPQYKSFKNNKRKLKKLWNAEEENETEIFKLKTFKINFNSINEYKKQRIVTIVNNELTDPDVFSWVVEFENLPDWAINSSKIIPTLSTENAYDTFNTFFTSPSSDDNFKVGDIILGEHKYKSYWEIQPSDDEQAEKQFIYIFRDGQSAFRQITSINEFFGTIGLTNTIPTYLKLDIVFINPKDYNEIQSVEKQI